MQVREEEGEVTDCSTRRSLHYTGVLRPNVLVSPTLALPGARSGHTDLLRVRDIRAVPRV